jgi:uncharacterized protein YPO0396
LSKQNRKTRSKRIKKMYELHRISLHNWYLIDALDLPVRGHSAVIGPTGAGKSSILDCIQTVISGNNRNALELNAAAGAHKGRSVRDYCLGTISDVNDGAPMRERCETTLALSYIDNKTKKQVVIGLFLYAETEKQETTKRFIIHDAEFKINDYIENSKVLKHTEMQSEIRKKHGDKNLKFYPNSTKFVGAFLELMRPKTPPDPKRFLRSFSNALQAKEMSDATDFVRKHVLEHMPLDVDSVRSSMSIWKELTEEVQRIETMVNELTTIDRNYQKGMQARVQSLDLISTESHLKLSAAKLEIASLKDDTDKIVEQENKINSEAAELKSEMSDLTAEALALEQKILSNDDGAQIAILDAKAGAAHEKRSSITKDIEADLGKIRDLKYIEGLNDVIPSASGVSNAAKKLSSMTLDLVPEELALKSSEIISSLPDTEIMQSAYEDLQAYNSKLTEDRLLKRRKLEEYGDVGEGGSITSPLSRNVTRFIAALDMEGIKAQCLPDLVDMSDTGWAFSVEALLGPNREAILVDPTDFRLASDILYNNRNQYDTVRLIDSRKLQNISPRLAENSIADVVKTSDNIIRKFIDYSVGRYSMAETEDDLGRFQNAVMRNGKTNSGVTRRVFRDRATILGKRAQKKAMEDSKYEREKLVKDISDLEKRIQQVAALIGRIQRAIDINLGALKDNLNNLSDAVNSLRGLRQQKETMQAPDLKDTEERLQAVKREIEEKTPQLKKMELASNQFQVKVGIFNDKIKELTARLPDFENKLSESVHNCAAAEISQIRNAINLEWPVLPVTKDDIDQLEGADPALALVKTNNLSTILDDYTKRFKEKNDEAIFIKRGTNGLLQYAQKWMLENLPLGDDDTDIDQFDFVSGQILKFRDHELLKYREKLTQARADMKSALLGGLVSKLGEQFSIMEQQLDGLNKRLSKHKFVGQTYQYKSQVSAKFLPIFELVKEQQNAPIGEDLEDDDERFEELEELFQGEEADAKKFEDYRNYFNFELFIEHPDIKDPNKTISTAFSSVIGKLSGGQRQAPHYVAIAASMVNAYYPKAIEGDTAGMGLVLFDEAFNKLDLKNTQRLMRLYMDLGLQVLVAAPEEKRASLIECVDCIISVNRSAGSDVAFIDTQVIGNSAKKAMLEENPAHLPVPD